MKSLERMKELDRTIIRLGHITALLEWDQETYLPTAALEERSNQAALLAGLHHEKIIDGEWEGLFEKLGFTGFDAADSVPDDMLDKLSVSDAAFVRESYKRWAKKVKIPIELVETLAKETSLSQAAWASARKTNDFSIFAPHLKRVIGLQRDVAAVVAPDADAYDFFLDEYEPGATGTQVAAVFDRLADGLVPLLDKIRGSAQPEGSFLHLPYSTDKQDEFGKQIQKFMGYDFDRGRLDITTHPFTTTLGPDDVRVTTRYDEKLVLSGLLSNIHEAGHGLYEQGFAESLHHSVLADGTSLGIHESQSRFWENIVGRSRAFWDFWYGDLQELYPENLSNVDVESFYKAVNLVQPSLIRVEADEVTYSFHIIVRFRLERALLRGEIDVDSLPEAWNQSYRDLLGITVPNDSLGVLQDVHWSVGLFGYFPTYALGNLYSAQFTKSMESSIGAIEKHLRAGNADEILEWLRANIHVHGRVYPPGVLCRNVSGESLNPDYFLEYLRRKYADVYGFSVPPYRFSDHSP